MAIYCEATLNFTDGVNASSVVLPIHDGRQANISFGQNGFELIEHQSSVTDWSDETEVRAKHYDEIRDLAKQVTGCDWVLFFPALIRDPEAAKQSEDLNPIQLVHSDYTESYRSILQNAEHPYHKIALAFAEGEGITSEDIVAAKRIATIQFWRNIGEPVVDYPLCVGDRNSFDRNDLLPYLVEEYGGVRTEFESFLVKPPTESDYKFFAFPKLTNEEVIMFRAYDSELAEGGEPFWTPHSAFRDPNAPEDAHRKSIEMRAICLWR